jgi:hypothetical protein
MVGCFHSNVTTLNTEKELGNLLRNNDACPMLLNYYAVARCRERSLRYKEKKNKPRREVHNCATSASEMKNPDAKSRRTKMSSTI